MGTGEKDSTIITVSNLDLNEGSLCQWKTRDNFSQPSDNVNYKLRVEGEQIDPHSISFPETKQTTFFLACQNSTIYRGELPTSKD